MSAITATLIGSALGWACFFLFVRWSRRQQRRQRIRDAHHREHCFDPLVVAFAREYHACICAHRLPCPVHPPTHAQGGGHDHD